MIKINLSEEEKERLTRLRLNSKSNMSERAYYVLLLNAGKSIPTIAKQLKRNIRTVRLWVNRYIEQGISGFKIKKQPGRPAKKAPLLETHLKELLKRTPQSYGYQEAGWQLNLLRHWFEVHQGLQVCDNTLTKALHKLGFVYKRFSKTIPKNSPSKQDKKDRVEKMVQEIKSKIQEDTRLLFLDESHFSNQPYVNRGWFKKGEKKGKHR